MAYRCVILLAISVACLKAAPLLSGQVMRLFNVEPLEDLSVRTIFNAPETDCIRPSHCRDIQRCHPNRSGVYRVYPFGIKRGFLAYCDMVSDGGGCLVFQRRQDGSVDFYKGWQKYKDGFGNLHGDFWLGLEKVHLLTSLSHFELLVNLGDFNGSVGSARYGRFRISDEENKYRLLVENYTGDAGDSMAVHNGREFSTSDNDNDMVKDGNCASAAHGSWWYKSCFSSNLNGEYVFVNGTPKGKHTAMTWYHWAKNYNALQFSEMKIRPI